MPVLRVSPAAYGFTLQHCQKNSRWLVKSFRPALPFGRDPGNRRLVMATMTRRGRHSIATVGAILGLAALMIIGACRKSNSPKPSTLNSQVGPSDAPQELFEPAGEKWPVLLQRARLDFGAASI